MCIWLETVTMILHQHSLEYLTLAIPVESDQLLTQCFHSQFLLTQFHRTHTARILNFLPSSAQNRCRQSFSSFAWVCLPVTSVYLSARPPVKLFPQTDLCTSSLFCPAQFPWHVPRSIDWPVTAGSHEMLQAKWNNQTSCIYLFSCRNIRTVSVFLSILFKSTLNKNDCQDAYGLNCTFMCLHSIQRTHHDKQQMTLSYCKFTIQHKLVSRPSTPTQTCT